MVRRAQGNAAEEARLGGGGKDTPTAPAKDSPDWKFYQASQRYLAMVEVELEEAREEELPAGITMAQTEARHKRIHLLELIEKKLEKVKKIWNGDPTPDLPMTE